MTFLYNCSIRAFSLIIGLGAIFSPKARLLWRGRRGLISRIEECETAAIKGNKGAIWVHCASLGEFEQGRSLIEALRLTHPVGTLEYRRIVVTFFSPSGYEIRHNYDQADAIYYLPADTPKNARRFVAAVRPEMAIFVKYEYWYNYLTALRENDTKSYIVSAIFRPDTVFFKSNVVGRFMRKILGLLSHFYVQNEASKELLGGIGFGEDRVTVSGDTRFDRVVSLASSAPELPLVATFAGVGLPQEQRMKVMVCGSTWPQDQEILLSLMSARPDLKFVVAPHELDSARIDALITRSGRKGIRYTSLNVDLEKDALDVQAEALLDADLLVIDTIGILSGVYKYGDLAYIGGGFGRGIHNTLEAVAWGMPVIFGPRYETFAEAVELVGLGVGVSVSGEADLLRTVDGWLSDSSTLALKGDAAKSYVNSRAGATKCILASIGE